MTELVILGSSNAMASPGHAHTHFLLLSDKRRVLIDCGTDPVVRLQEAGCELNSVTDVILTHLHPDHVSGFPILLMDMWLAGRIVPLNVYGLAFTLDRIQKMMDLYNWQEWPNFFTVNFNNIPTASHEVVIQDTEIQIFSSPVNHFLPNICLRIELQKSNKSIVYSSDTESCQSLLELSQNADILFHEASGDLPGHSSAAQAGKLAEIAKVKTLYLIHYPEIEKTGESILKDAANYFSGKIIKAVDFMRINADEI